MKLSTLFEHVDYLYVEDEFDTIANVPWDSGFTPLQAYEHITKGLHPEMKNSYDIGAIKNTIKSGKIEPITVDDDLDVVDCFHRIVAAKLLGKSKIPYAIP